MFASLGFVGGIIYLVIMVRVLWSLITDWQLRRQRVSLMILAVLLVTLAAWLVAGEYSIPLLLWLLIGAADAMTRKQEKA
jgi:Ca2+/Na+ antiporter